MTFKNLKNILGAQFENLGFKFKSGKWIVENEKILLECDLQKSNYDEQCWLNVKVVLLQFSNKNQPYCYFRIEKIKLEPCMILSKCLNYRNISENEANIISNNARMSFDILLNLLDFTFLQKIYRKYLLNNSLSNELFREIMQ